MIIELCFGRSFQLYISDQLKVSPVFAFCFWNIYIYVRTVYLCAYCSHELSFRFASQKVWKLPTGRFRSLWWCFVWNWYSGRDIVRLVVLCNLRRSAILTHSHSDWIESKSSTKTIVKSIWIAERMIDKINYFYYKNISRKTLKNIWINYCVF